MGPDFIYPDYLRKGYPIGQGYMGYDPEIHDYRLFSSDSEYHEYFDSLNT